KAFTANVDRGGADAVLRERPRGNSRPIADDQSQIEPSRFARAQAGMNASVAVTLSQLPCIHGINIEAWAGGGEWWNSFSAHSAACELKPNSAVFSLKAILTRHPDLGNMYTCT